jgi:hypothetical protein
MESSGVPAALRATAGRCGVRCATLIREGRKLGTGVERRPDATLRLCWA